MLCDASQFERLGNRSAKGRDASLAFAAPTWHIGYGRIRPRRFILASVLFLVNALPNSASSQQSSTFPGAELDPLFDLGAFQAEPHHPVLRYRLFRPTNVEPARKYPLLVWIHGFGHIERVNVNRGQLLHMQLVIKDATRPELYPFYIVAPQNSDSARWFGASKAGANGSSQDIPEPGEQLLDLIKTLLKEHPIDPDKVVLVGISSGGTAAWEFATRHPDVFAAVAPLASIGGLELPLEKMTGVPVWAFHSEDDSPERDRETVAHLKSLGGRAHLTKIPGRDHDCWSWAFIEHGLLNWLLAQQKGNPASPLPGPPQVPLEEILSRHPGSIAALSITLLGLIAMAGHRLNKWRRLASVLP